MCFKSRPRPVEASWLTVAKGIRANSSRAVGNEDSGARFPEGIGDGLPTVQPVVDIRLAHLDQRHAAEGISGLQEIADREREDGQKPRGVKLLVQHVPCVRLTSELERVARLVAVRANPYRLDRPYPEQLLARHLEGG
jgi:hypothetical protein